ncbi:MAG: hypothetical protein M1113_03460, partial [Candidatus Thermoplasmatota archaeon]|nr:hypothetical protein [Candidatus Thermoplasmatota archaeon]
AFVTGIAGSSDESIYLGYYHDNSFTYVSSFVNAEFNPFNSAFASWYSPFMYANGSMLYMFGTSKTNTCDFLEYAYNAANGTITGGNVAYDLSGARIQYVTGFNGNVLLLAPNVAYGFNTTDSIMSAQMDLPSIDFGNIFSAVQYGGNSIFMSGGQNPNVYYGILSFSFSSFGTGKYTVNFKESGLQYYIPSNTWYLSVSSAYSNYVYAYYSNSNLIVADLPFGTYTYYAGLVNGTEYLTGSFVLNSTTVSDMNVSLNFPTVYRITFMETGLGLAGTWGIRFSGQFLKDFTTYAGDSINIYASGNSNYTYFFNSNGNCIINTSYVGLIVSGNITSMIHIPATYEVTLEASNFTLGESWYALISNTYFASYVVNSSSYSSFDIGSSESSMSIYLPNGSYFVEYGIYSYSRTFNDTFSVNGSSINIVLSLPSLYILRISWFNQPSSLTGFNGYILFVNGIEYSQYSASVNETSLDLSDGSYLISSTMLFGNQNGLGQDGSINGPQFYANITGSNLNLSVNWYTLNEVEFGTNLNITPQKAVVSISLQGVHGVSVETSGENLTSINLYLPNGTYQPVLNGYFNNTKTFAESSLKVAGKNLSYIFYLYLGHLEVFPSVTNLNSTERNDFYNLTSFNFGIFINNNGVSISGNSVRLYLSNNTYNVNFNAIYDGTTSIIKFSSLIVSGETFFLNYTIPFPFY